MIIQNHWMKDWPMMITKIFKKILIGYNYQLKRLLPLEKSLLQLYSKLLEQTFFLKINYQLQYRINQPNFKKSKPSNVNQSPVISQKRQARSKLIHGSILESQDKQLYLYLKSKKIKAYTNQNQSTLPTLKRLQFSIVRIFQNKNDGKLIAKQFINNPKLNQEYEIQLEEIQTVNQQKAKPVVQITFQLNQLQNSEESESEEQDKKILSSEINESLDKSLYQPQKFEHYTLGLTNNQRKLNNEKTQQSKPNVFLGDQIANQENDSSQLSQNSDLHRETVIKQLNQLSKYIQQDLSKSKNQDAVYRNYLDETNSYLDDLKSEQQLNIKIRQNEKQKKDKIEVFKQNVTNLTIDQPTIKEGKLQNSESAGQRYHYVSRLETTLPNQQSQNIKIPATISPINKNAKNINFKQANIQTANKIQKKPENIIQVQKIKDSNQNEKQAVKGSNNQNKDNFYQTNNQAYSRWIPANLTELDNSNIRFKYEQNQISNLDQSKQVQGLINQIQLIEKQWHKKRFLDKKSKLIKAKISAVDKQADQKKPQVNKDTYMDLQLKKFKIKFSQENFYRKLFDCLKSKHLNYLDNNNKKEVKQKQTYKNVNIPNNYLVYLKAYEIDQEKAARLNSQECPKIQIAIPSDQIGKLIELQEIQNENNPLDYSKQSLKSQITSKSMPKILERQMIKAFEKQLYSKVMRVKICKQNDKSFDKKSQKAKRRARIIEIALQDETILLDKNNNQINSPTPLSKSSKNRINLVGMYPIPIFDDQQKQLQTSFYQNVSVQALSIAMYNVQTGAQEGKVCFELKKGNQDKEIQTLEPLQNFNDLDWKVLAQNNEETRQKRQTNLSQKFKIQGKVTSDRLQQNYDKQKKEKQHDINASKKFQTDEQKQYAEQQSSIQYVSKAKNMRSLENNQQIQKVINQTIVPFKSRQKRLSNQSFKKQNEELDVIKKSVSLNGVNKPNIIANQKKRGDSINMIKTANPNSFRSQIVPNTQLSRANDNYNDNQNKITSFEENISQNQQDSSQIGDYKFQNVIIGNNKKEEQSPYSSYSRLLLTRANMDQDLIGKIIKNSSSSYIQISLETIKQKNQIPLIPISNAIQKQRKQLAVSSIKYEQNKRRLVPSNNQFRSSKPQQTSYRQLKQQLQQTSSLISSLKNKTQSFIEKRENQRKIEKQLKQETELKKLIQKQKQAKDQLIKDSKQQYISKAQDVNPKIHYISPIKSLDKPQNIHPALKKRMVNLQVTSSVINQSIVTKKQIKSRNQNDEIPKQTNQVPLSSQTPLINQIESFSSNKKAENNSKKTQQPIRNMNDKNKLQNKQSQFEINPKKMKQNQKQKQSQLYSSDTRKQKTKGPLKYKQQSQYHFHSKQDVQLNNDLSNNKNARKQSVIREKNAKRYFDQQPNKGNDSKYNSYETQRKPQYKQKFVGKDQINSYSERKSKLSFYNQDKHPNIIQKYQKQIPSSLSWHPQRQIIQVNLSSVKIKLLALPQLKQFSSKSYHSEILKKQEYFVLIYTDFLQNIDNIKTHYPKDFKITNFSPIAQKCFPSKNQSQFQAFFSDIELQNQLKKQKIRYEYAPFFGLQTSKLYIELYQSSNQPKKQEVKSKEQNHIDLITVLPSKKKVQNNQNQPIGLLSVTFLQLLAQKETKYPYGVQSFGVEKQTDLIHYTNFLYKKQKILAKININYSTLKENQNQNLIQIGKPTDLMSYNKYQNTNIDTQDNINRFRSQSGLTKKLNTKKNNRFLEQNQSNQPQNHFSKQFKRSDHLQILKRRIPKPFKQHEQVNNKSRSVNYLTHLNKPNSVQSIKKHSQGSLSSSSADMKNINKANSDVKSKNSSYYNRYQNQINYKQSSSSYLPRSRQFIYDQQEGQSPKKALNLKNKQLPQLRYKKQQKMLQKLNLFKRNAVIRPSKIQQTRTNQRKYEGGSNIKFNKSSRFNSDESRQKSELKRKDSKQQIPGPGQYEVKSIFDRHTIKEP